MNIVVLRGVLSSDPKQRTLPSGDELITYEVTTEVDGAAVSAPVAWHRPRQPPALTSGDDVVVVGHLRRRFFRAGGATVSRTEVVADTVARDGTKRARRTLEALAATVESGIDERPAA